MPERKELFTVSVISDDDTGMYTIGEVDGGMSTGYLKDYLKEFGNEGKDNLLTHLSFIQYQIWNMWGELNEKGELQGPVKRYDHSEENLFKKSMEKLNELKERMKT